MAAIDSNYKIEKLNENNYRTWSFKMIHFLAEKEVADVIEKEKPNPVTEEWKKKAKKVLQIIALMIDNDQVTFIRGCDDGKQAWEALKEIYCREDAPAQVEMYTKLFNMKLEHGGNMHEHLRKMFEVISIIREMGAQVSDNVFIGAILHSLNNDYAAISSGIRAWDEKALKVHTVRAKLIEEWERISANSTMDNASLVRRRKKAIFTCYSCGGTGHLKRNCPQRSDLRKKLNKLRANVAEDKNKECSAKTSRYGQWYLCSVSFKDNSSISGWIVDSGATNHMCCDKKLFTNINYNHNGTVLVANGEKLQVKGIGTVVINILSNNKLMTVELANALYVPQLDGHLVSVKKLTDRGYHVKFKGDVCLLKKNEEKEIVIAHNNNGLYKISSPPRCFIVEESAQEGKCVHKWHRVLAHKNLKDIRAMRNNGLNVIECKCSDVCESCIRGKMSRKPFPRKASPTNEVLDCIVSDICGPMQVESLGKKRYFITFIDIHSKFTEVKLMHQKSEAADLIIQYIEKLKTQIGRKPKIFRSDRGTEYMSKKIQDYFKSEGIIFQCTVGYAPEQNGIAERMNRTLVEAVRSMLVNSGFQKSLWGEAVSTACYIFNRTNTKGKSPYEIWHGVKPNFTNLHEFGCDVYSMIPYEKRRKLDDKAEKLKFVGYDESSKGYRLINKDNKVIISREVYFLESKSPLNSEKTDEQDSKNEITFNFDDNDRNNHQPENNLENGDENEIFLDAEDNQIQEEVIENEPIQEEVVQNNPIQEEPRAIEAPRRSTRSTAGKLPSKYNDFVTFKVNHDDENFEPKNFKEATSCHHAKEWIEAMREEIKSIEDNKTWELVDLPRGRMPIGSKWVFKLKRDENNKIIRRKARLVAQGFSQKFGIDYDEVFAPVVRSATFRLLLSVAGVRGYAVRHFDIKTAFLNGNLNEEIYMRQPTGFKNGDKVFKLHKSLYGLKQAARVWNQTLHEELINNGCNQSDVDKCLYILKVEKGICYLLIHVDDMLVAYNNQSLMSKLMSNIGRKFEMKDLGNAKHFLEIDIKQDRDGNFMINQSRYIDKIISETGLVEAKISNHPLDTGYWKLNTDEQLLESNDDYRKIIGMLLYLTTHTRPDIAAAVSILSQRVQNPRVVDLNEAKRIVRYLKGTKDLNLMLSTSNCSEKLYAYSDANWAEDKTDRKSNSGYYCSVNGGAISWSCRKQDVVAMSSTEAEFIALSETCKEMNWIRRVVKDFGVNINGPTTIYTDSQSAISMINNQKFSNRTKHIDVKYHYVRDKVMTKEAVLAYQPTDKNVADMMTKPLGGTKIKELRRFAGLT